MQGTPLPFSLLLVKVKPPDDSGPCQLPENAIQPLSKVVLLCVTLSFPFHAYSLVLQQVIMNQHDLCRCSSLMCLAALPGILLPPLPPGSLGQRGSPTLPARHGADG